ncbi:hypothetical protein PFISCL1PPCAC_29096 [Pristionchus fissidentatus]|uniref:C-type lectin n=1 Tax=Pristionchus fissidentatus TaxID=1538716 RepID=A0AAV5VCR4_9BILA|nr:hypothetical protein PFISCL1PPCAC_7818 [Pristionchus fissidentatus]GMT37799.1 hypothetical protein PFISCL1PPCAC_29096 [Pristionchus fissidentatus]
MELSGQCKPWSPDRGMKTAAATLTLLLCTLQSVSSFVFSCEEIKSKLINTQRIENTDYACVFLEEGLEPSASYLSNIFLLDQLNKTSYSLASVAASSSHCVKAEGYWSVISDRPSDLTCDKEIALIFSSDDKTQYIQANSYSIRDAYPGGRVTIVSPRSGMKITILNIDSTQSQLNGEIDFYTGAGTGENEGLFLLKSWNKHHAPLYIASFDNVVTLTSTNKDVIYYITSAVNNATRLGPGDRAAIVSSGKSDNVMNMRPEDNYVTYDLWQGAQANVTGSLYFDKNYQGSINITIRGDSKNEERSFHDGELDYVFDASYFELKYLTSVRPEEVWQNDDTFVIEIELSEVPVDITPIPGIRTNDRYCNCAIEDGWFADDWDPAEIWVDVVILLDTSASMGDSLEEVKSLITSFISLLSTDTSAKFYSRVGVIAVSDTVDVIYNLNMSSTDDLDMIKKHNVDKIDVGAGIQAALKMFGDGKSMSSYRENARQIIYCLSNSAPGTNLNGVDDFKAGGGIVIVNDFVLEGEQAIPGLKNLASDNYFFTDLSDNFINSLGLFCEANCFCDSNHHPFNDDKVSPRTEANRGCFRSFNDAMPFEEARTICHMADSSLVSIHDADKEYFVSSVVAMFGSKKKYWIALENDGTNWVWDDKSTDPFNDWDKSTNQPNTNGGKLMCAYAVNSQGLNVGWTAANCAMDNFYVCESVPCSAGNNVC